MPSGLPGFVLRRAASAIALVLIVSSTALVLARLAPGDPLAGFGTDPAAAAEERRRRGLDRPLLEQYAVWVSGLVRFDLGESARYPGRRVDDLVADRAARSALLGAAALLLATAAGIPLGVLTGSRRRGLLLKGAQLGSLLLISVPPIVLSLTLLLVASRTGLFPTGGFPESATLAGILHHLVLPVLALGLPAAAVLERLQSRSLAEALHEPAIRAARARGIPRWRVVWLHGFRLSLRPVLAVYGVLVGGLISGSFVVEYVMTWPGLGRLMYDALIYRDANLVAGCAAAGAAFLALGIFAGDVANAAADPRIGGSR